MAPIVCLSLFLAGFFWTKDWIRLIGGFVKPKKIETPKPQTLLRWEQTNYNPNKTLIVASVASMQQEALKDQTGRLYRTTMELDKEKERIRELERQRHVCDGGCVDLYADDRVVETQHIHKVPMRMIRQYPRRP